MKKFKKKCKTLAPPNGEAAGFWTFECDVVDETENAPLTFVEYETTDENGKETVRVGILLFAALLENGNEKIITATIQKLKIDYPLQDKYAISSGVNSTLSEMNDSDCNFKLYKDSTKDGKKIFETVRANAIVSQVRMFPMKVFGKYAYDELKNSYVHSLVSNIPDSRRM